MPLLDRYSERYSATGGLAAQGVLNQLGRPDIEALEVLVREAIQNCWDAKRADVGRIRVEIGAVRLDAGAFGVVHESFLSHEPAGLPLGRELVRDMKMLYFADFGTDGLGGPTRADHVGEKRDFVDFVWNIGQPPDKDLGGGSFGYGKAAFFIASRARTIVVDTLCVGVDGNLERRLIGCSLGDNYCEGGRPYTGRHWWGRVVDGLPEPLVGHSAGAVARQLGLPERSDHSGLGTTIVVLAPGVTPDSDDGSDRTMEFIADALAWNFWPRMISTPGGTRPTMEFRVLDDGREIRVPDPRRHVRLRGFVEAMDRLREEGSSDDPFVMDRSVECLRPVRTLGRLVIQKGPVAPVTRLGRVMPQGARVTADSVHHVALMRNAELIVKYLAGPLPATGRLGYSGVFRCLVSVDDAFRESEPPTHDDWIYRAVPRGHERTFVKVALDRIASFCREAAGYQSSSGIAASSDGVPLGEFADSLAQLMPGSDGPGARRPRRPGARASRRRRHAPGRTATDGRSDEVWVVAESEDRETAISEVGRNAGQHERGLLVSGPGKRRRLPEARPGGEPLPAIASDGAAVVRYAFDLRGHGNRLRLKARVEVMTNDGFQVEAEAPSGYQRPEVRAWIDPEGSEHPTAELTYGPEGVDGRWHVEVPLRDETMMRVDIAAEIV